eukprot:2260710-Lingulodinium_polyedra.AAC.1
MACHLRNGRKRARACAAWEHPIRCVGTPQTMQTYWPNHIALKCSSVFRHAERCWHKCGQKRGRQQNQTWA